MEIFERLQEIESRYEDLEKELGDPEVVADQERFSKCAKVHAELEEVVSVYRKYKKAAEDLDSAKAMLSSHVDREFREFLESEISTLSEEKESLENRLKILLLPRDPNDYKNVLVEIRGGAGGEEAALFAADLFRMYSRYAERHGWRTEMMSSNPTDLGGFKEVIFMVEGRGAYSRLKYESGVHRVQRVPTTEASGRIHTSTATVAVLPEAEEVEVDIKPEELRIEVFRSTGHGGQSVNTTDSAVRIVHIPTGLVVTCQDERSQLKNKEKAMRVLRARLLDMAQREQEARITEARRSQVGTGDRSERIRTYNFPQNRVTDHRIGFTTHRLEAILDGDLDELVDALLTADQAEKLRKIG